MKVGYIGMTLEATPTLVAQAGIRGIEFRDEVETANRSARELRRRGVQTIIVLLHEGGFQAGTYQQCAGISGPVVEIAKNLHPEIDLVVTGHTHQPYICNIPDPAGRNRMVTSASSFGRVVTETTLTISTRTGDVKRNRTTSTNHLVTRTNPDPVQTEIINRWDAASAPIGNRVVGSISADITRSVDRNTEGPLANLIADAQLAATTMPGEGGAQIAFMNPGGVRADLTYKTISGGEQPGEVTYREAFDVQPFGNLLVTMNLTGAQIERLLEQQARVDAQGNVTALIFGVSKGFTFSYNPAGAVGDRIDPASIRAQRCSSRTGDQLPDRHQQLSGRRRRLVHRVHRRDQPDRGRRRPGGVHRVPRPQPPGRPARRPDRRHLAAVEARRDHRLELVPTGWVLT